MGMPVLVINSLDIARELLDKRSVNYSNRPQSVMLNKLYAFDCVISIDACRARMAISYDDYDYEEDYED